MEKILISMDQLYKIEYKLFVGMGYTEREADYAAKVLTETDRRGVDTHGTARIRFYYSSAKKKSLVNKNAQLKIIRDEAPYIMVDADHGLGIIMAPQAVELAIERAKKQRLCIMGIQNSNHFGAAGYYASKCVAQGFISLVCSNSPATMVPLGGKKSILGNSPWSLAIPGGKRHPDPVMFDMACSEVARGKCETAMREGRQVPIGWGVNADGEACTDPDAILHGGSLLPFGGAKGYCLAVLIEALSSMLTFASFGNGTNMNKDQDNTSHFVLLMDPAKFGRLESYKNSIDEYVDSIKNVPLAKGAKEIIIPGELEARCIQRRTKNGIELDEEIVSAMAAIAGEIGLLGAGQGFAEMLAW